MCSGEKLTIHLISAETFITNRQLGYLVYPSFSDFAAENFPAFRPFKERFNEFYEEIVRDLPRDLHSLLKKAVTDSLSTILSGSQWTLKLTVDANVIVADCIRVAEGKDSDTDKMLESPYVELYGPDKIDNEVFDVLKRKVKNPQQLKVAIARAKLLLSKINHVTSLSSRALRKAMDTIGNIDPGDVPYLAIALDTSSIAVLSQDKKAFGSQMLVKRWTMRDETTVVLTYEKGSLGLVVTSITLKLLFETFAKVIVLLLNAVFEIIGFALQVVKGFVGKSADVLSRIPKWLLVVILVLIITLAASAAINEDFRAALGDFLTQIFGAFLSLIESFWTVLKALSMAVIVAIKPILEDNLPYFLIVYAVLMDNIQGLMQQAKQFRYRTDTAGLRQISINARKITHITFEN